MASTLRSPVPPTPSCESSEDLASEDQPKKRKAALVTSSFKKLRSGPKEKLETWSFFGKGLNNLPPKRKLNFGSEDCLKDDSVIHCQGSMESDEIDYQHWADRSDPYAYDREDKKKRRKKMTEKAVRNATRADKAATNLKAAPA